MMTFEVEYSGTVIVQAETVEEAENLFNEMEHGELFVEIDEIKELDGEKN